MKKLSVFIGTLFMLAELISAHSGTDDYAHHGMMSCFYGAGFNGMNFFGWIFMLLIIVALVLLVIWLIKQIQKK